jgi:hypothetical protein
MSSVVIDPNRVIMPRPGSTHLSLIETLNDLESLRADWMAMQSHPNADIDFYIDVVTAWSKRCTPYVLVISKDGVPQAILVGRAETNPIECKLGYKTLLRIKACQLTFIYGGQLGQFTPEYCLLFADAIESALRQGNADLAEFHFVRHDSELCADRLWTLPLFKSSVQVHRSTTIGSSAEETFRDMSSKRRRNLRGRRLQQDFGGRARIRCFRDLCEVKQLWADVESIARRTYHRQLGFGFDGSEDLLDRLTAELARGRLRVYLLYLADQPAAFWIATAYKQRLFSDFMGYEPTYADYSPGMYLVVRTLETLSANDPADIVREVDWGLGDAQYKKVLGDTSWTEANVQILGATGKGRVLQYVMVPIAKANTWLKNTLANLGYLQKLKTNWRRSQLKRESEAST